MRVFFFFDTFSSTPTAASSNDQIQKFYFFPWRTWASDGLLKKTILFSQELYSLVNELHYPPPPQLLFWDALRQRKHWRTDVALDFFLWPIYFVIKLFRDWDLNAEMLPCYIPANTAFS